MPNTTFNVTIFKFTSSLRDQYQADMKGKIMSNRLVIICVYQNSQDCKYFRIENKITYITTKCVRIDQNIRKALEALSNIK